MDNNIKHAITSRLEHHAVIHTLDAMQKAGVISLSFVDTDSKSNIDYEQLETLLKIMTVALFH